MDSVEEQVPWLNSRALGFPFGQETWWPSLNVRSHVVGLAAGTQWGLNGNEGQQNAAVISL